MSIGRILILGDVVGESGMRVLEERLSELVEGERADLVVVNAENAAEGFGLTVDDAERLWRIGVSVITTGNHIWQRRKILEYMKSNNRLLRPANYPGEPAGSGLCIVDFMDRTKVAVINVQGRVRLSNVECPFRSVSSQIESLPPDVKTIVVDFHAEDTEEKEAMARYLDGSVSAVVGTHTHVQTADARVSDNGTGSITDLGMTGPIHSVIGFNPEIARNRMISQMPLKMEVSDESAAIRGVAIEVDSDSGRCMQIRALDLKYTE